MVLCEAAVAGGEAGKFSYFFSGWAGTVQYGPYLSPPRPLAIPPSIPPSPHRFLTSPCKRAGGRMGSIPMSEEVGS